MTPRETVEEWIGVAAVAIGAVVALSQSSGLLAILVVMLILVECGVLWMALRRLGGDARDIGSRLLVLVGLALTAFGMF